MFVCIYVKYPLFLSDFNETGNFSAYFRKILKCKISSNSVQWEPNCSMQTDGLEVASSRFSQFCELTEKFCGEKIHFVWFQTSAAN